MEESSYKHNYEYLSIEEAKSIISGTFVQGTTNIGGELITKSDINKLLTTANKKLTSIVPSTVADNEFVCFFECINKEEFPDDVAHRWIEVSPIQFTFPANGGSVKITGSYGLTGTLGTRRKVGDINDTITVGANATPSSKSGSKTYHYSNDQSQTPTAKVSWTQPNKPEEFPDDQAHRWIRVQPVSSQISVDGGTIKVTGSYGLTGTYGTEKKVGDITDTITVERNSTQSPKSGSKTYHYNNNQTDNPTATITWTQPGRAEEFPDDQAHRWIRVQPVSSQISVDGGTIKVTGSYGLTGTYGTEKKVGDITDTITVERNSTQSPKSGSKTYHYNNNQTDNPTATITWTQPGRAEEFPDDQAHRWIEITPTNAGNFTESGGTITVTGSYGLIGSFGTKKTVGQINDTITVERNTTTQTKSGSKTYYYNNTPGTDPSATVTWTQDAHIETFTYTYEFKIGLSQDDITKDTSTLLFESTQYGAGSKVPVYYKSVKKKINESGYVVETTDVDIRKSEGTTNNSVVEINNGVIYVYPKAENSSLIDKRFDNYTFTNDNGNKCRIQFIQDIAGIKILPCDAVKFTYKWSNGSDLDQAVYINTNYPGIDNECYSGYGGNIEFYGDVGQFLKFAGDNTGTGNEYTFIEFTELQKWLQLNKDKQSSINGKTVIESLTDDNGISSIKVDLYANWYGEIGSNTYIQYTLYNRDGDNQNIDVDKLNKQFILTGYQEKYNFQQNFTCHSYGKELWVNPHPRKNYTKIGEFVVYLNSNNVSFQSNTNNYNKWQAGVVTQYETPSSIDYQYSMTDNNDKCNVTVNLRDFTCNKLHNDDEFEISLHGVAIPVNAGEDINPYMYSNDVRFTKSVSKQEFPTQFSFEFDVNTFITEVKASSILENYTGQVYIYIAIQSEKFIKIERSFVMNKEFFLIKGDHITRSI